MNVPLWARGGGGGGSVGSRTAAGRAGTAKLLAVGADVMLVSPDQDANAADTSVGCSGGQKRQWCE